MSYLKLQELRRRQKNKSQAYVPDEYIKAIDLDPKQLSRKDSHKQLIDTLGTNDKAHASDLDKQIYFHYDHDPVAATSNDKHKSTQHLFSVVKARKSSHFCDLLHYFQLI